LENNSKQKEESGLSLPIETALLYFNTVRLKIVAIQVSIKHRIENKNYVF